MLGPLSVSPTGHSQFLSLGLTEELEVGHKDVSMRGPTWETVVCCMR